MLPTPSRMTLAGSGTADSPPAADWLNVWP